MQRQARHTGQQHPHSGALEQSGPNNRTQASLPAWRRFIVLTAARCAAVVFGLVWASGHDLIGMPGLRDFIFTIRTTYQLLLQTLSHHRFQGRPHRMELMVSDPIYELGLAVDRIRVQFLL